MRQQPHWNWMLVGSWAILLAGVWPAPIRAQQSMEVKEKPPMYLYIAEWEVPRNQWKDIESETSKNRALMQKFLEEGNIVGYGSDVALIHQDGDSTHDTWWASMSIANLMRVLEANKTSGSADAPVFAASKHHDDLWECRYYNWRSGSFTNGYTRVASWKLKADAPSDAIDQMARNFYVPLLEQLLADGSIYEYEISEENIHTGDPSIFFVLLIANGPEGIDKWNAAMADALKRSPFASSMFGSWVDYSAHRDGLDLTTATFK